MPVLQLTFFIISHSGLQLRVIEKISFTSTKTYVVGTQKNSLIRTVLLSTKNMLKMKGKKLITILSSNV